MFVRWLQWLLICSMVHKIARYVVIIYPEQSEPCNNNWWWMLFDFMHFYIKIHILDKLSKKPRNCAYHNVSYEQTPCYCASVPLLKAPVILEVVSERQSLPSGAVSSTAVSHCNGDLLGSFFFLWFSSYVPNEVVITVYVSACHMMI